MFQQIFKKACFICRGCKKSNIYLTETQRIYENGYYLLDKELDITNVIKTMLKLKAGIQAIAEKDADFK